MPSNLDLCRLCGQKKKIKVDVFHSGSLLLHKILSCLNLKITQDDLLPKAICFECQRLVDQYFSFRVKCHRVEQKLQKLITQGGPKSFPGIKEECDAAESLRSWTNDHTYVAQLPQALTKSIPRVKVEADEQLSEDDSDFLQIIAENVNGENGFIEAKEPVIEIIVDREDLIQVSPPCPVFESDVKHHDAKPVIIDCLEENTTNEIVVADPVECETLTEADEAAVSYDVDVEGDLEHYETKRSLDIPPAECADGFDLGDYIDQAVDVESKKLNEPAVALSALFEGNEELIAIASDYTEAIEPSDGRTHPTSDLNDFNWDNLSDSHFRLADGEECTLDMEEMEAEIAKKINPAVRFQCNKCDKKFKFFKAMRKHRQSHDDETALFNCDFCLHINKESRDFSSLQSLKAHISRIHLSDSMVSCKVCSENFRTKSECLKHIRTSHTPSMYTCKICRKQFKTRRSFRDHERCHSLVRPYICDDCGKDFRWPAALRAHIESHSSRKNFLCAECGKKFSSKKTMIEHFNIHRGIRPFECSLCGATFPHMSSLSRHGALHKKERYTCGVCAREFTQPYLLKEHEYSHSGTPLYSCPVCGRTFSTRSNLCNHSKIHGARNYKCTSCDMSFLRKSHLSDHMMRHTGTRHICPAPDCSKAYTQRTPLGVHFKKKHPEFVMGTRRDPYETAVAQDGVQDPNENAVAQDGVEVINRSQYECWSKETSSPGLKT